MRTIQVDFIDDEWYAKKDREVKEMKTMIDGVTEFLTVLSKQKDEVNIRLEQMTDERVSDSQNMNAELSTIRQSITDLSNVVNKFIEDHEEAHKKNNGILSGLFKSFK